MVEVECPWCEAELALPAPAEEEEQGCPFCLTSWTYVSSEAELSRVA